MGMAQKSGYVSVTTRSGDPDKDLILERSHGAFDSAVAEEFLIRYAASGQKTRSAQEVGYTGQHINNVAKNDECFARAVKESVSVVDGTSGTGSISPRSRRCRSACLQYETGDHHWAHPEVLRQDAGVDVTQGGSSGLCE